VTLPDRQRSDQGKHGGIAFYAVTFRVFYGEREKLAAPSAAREDQPKNLVTHRPLTRHYYTELSSLIVTMDGC